MKNSIRRGVPAAAAPQHRFVEALEPRTLLSYVPPTNPRADLNLDSSWKFTKGDPVGASTTSFNDSGWSTVTLPHTWNNKDGQDGGNDYYRGTSWYRRHYTIPTTYSGKQFYLKFDGAYLSTDLYVNGTPLGNHRGGYSTFLYDLTPYVQAGQDITFAVKVNNANDVNTAPWFNRFAPDWTLSGGIYRDVHLVVTNSLQVTPLDFGSSGVFLKPTNVTSASVNLQVTAELRNAGGSTKNASVVATVVDAAGNVIKTLNGSASLAAKVTSNVVMSTTITSPHLWNGTKDPYLYKVYVQVKDAATGGTTDLISQPLGFRFFKMDPNKGFSLNGQSYEIKGVSFHQDRLDKGPAASPSNREEDIGLVREIGANTVRLAHYQHAQGTYDRLDKYGLLAWSELPLDANITTSTTSFTDNLKRQLREMIRQNYNHPSVFLWGLHNELSNSIDSYSLVTKLQNSAKLEDPTRLTIGASNLTNDGDVTSFATDLMSWNKYYGWYNVGPLSQFASWADTVHRNFPNEPIAIAEYGAGADLNDHAGNPSQPSATNTPFHPEEYQNILHETYLSVMKSRPFIWGKFAWEMFDSASDWRNEGAQAGRNDKGLVTYDRKTKKDAFYLYKANWSSSSVLYITSRRFTNRTDATTDVKVYSNCSSVTLNVNGNTIGTITPNNIKVAKWTGVTLQPGANTISVTGTRSGMTYTDTVTWNLTVARTALAAAPAMFSRAFIGPTKVDDSLVTVVG